MFGFWNVLNLTEGFPKISVYNFKFIDKMKWTLPCAYVICQSVSSSRV